MRNNKRISKSLILTGLILLLTCGLAVCNSAGQWMHPAFAESIQSAATAAPDWPRGRLLVSNPAGENVYAWGIFRIIYHTRGEHAVPEADYNQNGIPDFVEDLALQLVVAHHIFCDLMGFPAPLKSERYKDVAYIDVFVNSRERVGANGHSFQVPERARPPVPQSALALRMRIARDLPLQKNVTPAHEYFHHIQNGATRLTNPWFHEGMAVWSHDAMMAIPFQASSWSQVKKYLYDPQSMEELYAASYNAGELLWLPLARLCPDGEEHLPDGDPLLQSRYVDGTPVLKDFILRGAPVMRAILREFGAVEETAFLENGYKEWSYANRSSPRNYPYLIRAIRNVVDRQCR
ncbi:MAG: hypothetical protein FWF86_03455 [Clostridia bacterium]|nr:hypothetical protein [Clostridia bacterium]